MDLVAVQYNIIADAQLCSFGFSPEFIDYIRAEKLPFKYIAGTTDGRNFIREMRHLAESLIIND
jgi:hypothetical protein